VPHFFLTNGESLDQEELDSLLQIIENPVRRRIIKRLAQEPAYALQLSKELGLGQPLVAKHMAIMEKAGLVTWEPEISSSGPRRRRYSLAKGVSITMDLAPNLFIERGTPIPGKVGAAVDQANVALRSQLRVAMEGHNDKERLSLLSQALKDIDEKLAQIDEERTDLLGVRNQAMEEATRITVKLEGMDKKRVLFHILDEHDMQAQSISESLDLRELTVKSILEELARDYFE